MLIWLSIRIVLCGLLWGLLYVLISALESDLRGGREVPVRLLRDQKPQSEPHHFWLWRWA